VAGFGPFLTIVLVVGLILGAILTTATRISILAAVAICAGFTFLLGWIGWFSIEMGLFAGLAAALSSLAGGWAGKRLKLAGKK
jgi:hypothetical protein